MTRIPTPTVTPESKAEHVSKVLVAAEAARVLHNALHELQLDEPAYRDAVQHGVAGVAWKERLDLVEGLEGELLEHAMRITLG